MNILILSQYFWPEPFRISDLAVGLKEKGYDVTVISCMPNYPAGKFYPGYKNPFIPKKEVYNGITALRMPIIPKGKGTALRMVLYYMSLAISASIIGPLMCRRKFDLIFVYQPSPVTVGLPALIFKLLHRAPIIFWVQDIWPETLSATGMVSSKLVLRMVGKLVRFIYSGCDKILVQSEAFIPRIRKMNVPADKIRYYPNYAESLYQPVTLEPDALENRQMPEGFRIMFAGNIGRAQDFPTILSAAEKLKAYSDIHWVILGDGTKRSWVEREARERGLDKNIHLLGRYPIEQMPRYFSLADVLLVTLKKDLIFSLTIPSKVQSYMACAKPIAAALDGEGKRLIHISGCGLCASSGDSATLADIVLKLYRMTQKERDNMGQLGRRYFETHFDRSGLIRQLDCWMKQEVPK